MIKRHFKLYQASTLFCMGLLAVNLLGCTSETEEEPKTEEEPVICIEPLDSYSFTIDGSITTEDGENVTNATIKVKYSHELSNYLILSENRSDETGAFKVTGESVRVDTYKVICIPDDPTLESDSIVVEAKNTFLGYDKERNTYYGVSEATADFKLKKLN